MFTLENCLMTFIYLLLHMDDMLIVTKNKDKITSMKALLSIEFKMKDFGATKKILGMEIQKYKRVGILYVSQEKYIKKVLQSFQIEHSKLVSTSSSVHFKLDSRVLSSTNEDGYYMNKVIIFLFCIDVLLIILDPNKEN